MAVPRIIASLGLMLLVAWGVAISAMRWGWDAAAPQQGLARQGAGASRLAAGERPEVPPPPFSEGIYPCSGCHAGMTPNPARRALTEMHGDIELRHDEEHRWCLDCHDAADRDSLHLASGEKVPFAESYRLCGQCHGEKYRDWRAGVHGRRIGEWNGHKEYLLCAHCHNPHRPGFQPIVPKPAPRPPRRASYAGAQGETR
jgi:hypothetical protein